LAYSRVDRRGLEFAPVNLHGALDYALANLRVAIEESGAEIVAEGLPTVQGDGTQLVLLFQNLVGNAIKFRREGVAPRIRIEAKQEGGRWAISVQDNGIGIPPEHYERVFMIFQRLHSRGARYPGTGIGLAICKKIVERHGGRIWVESTPGEGSTFRFTLPNS
jgi:signal transduction histidine kinase